MLKTTDTISEIKAIIGRISKDDNSSVKDFISLKIQYPIELIISLLNIYLIITNLWMSI